MVLLQEPSKHKEMWLKQLDVKRRHLSKGQQAIT